MKNPNRGEIEKKLKDYKLRVFEAYGIITNVMEVRGLSEVSRLFF